MIRIKTSIPGARSARILFELKRKNGGWNAPHPLVFSGKGKGAYCEDIDGNRFLDFASQVASNPLGYNHPAMLKVIKEYQRFPIKYAGQDFTVKEHLDMINELAKISPKGMGAAFLVNSGSEAVENAIKIAMRERKKKRFGVSLEGGFHGRTLGALSQHHSNQLHRDGYTLLPNKGLPFDDSAGEKLQEIIDKDGADSISFVIAEHLQGEGGYRIASKKMIKDLRKITRENDIPYIADEVQSGIGRTGKWWSFEHYSIRPDIFSSAKALQIGAVVANKKIFPAEHGAISSTWGGGHVLDLALGIKTIETIRKDKLLLRNKSIGNYILKSLNTIEEIHNIRGKGLMIGFDLESKKMRNDFVIECVKQGLLILGCGEKSVRIIPPYIIQKSEIDEGISVIEKTAGLVSHKNFKHKGQICRFIDCGNR